MMTDYLRARGGENEEEKYMHNIEAAYKKYSKMIYQVSFSYMKNPADAEDIIADVFVKLIAAKKEFQSEEHEKAWILRAAINLCKDRLKHWRRKCVNIDERENLQGKTNLFEPNEILKSVMELPEKYKSVVYLHYYEGYTAEEIAKILKKPQSSIRVHLHKARKLLKEVLSENEK